MWMQPDNIAKPVNAACTRLRYGARFLNLNAWQLWRGYAAKVKAYVAANYALAATKAEQVRRGIKFRNRFMQSPKIAQYKCHSRVLLSGIHALLFSN
jgi:hypothetical protein